jgi:hypothetical protein
MEHFPKRDIALQHYPVNIEKIAPLLQHFKYTHVAKRNKV